MQASASMATLPSAAHGMGLNRTQRAPSRTGSAKQRSLAKSVSTPSFRPLQHEAPAHVINTQEDTNTGITHVDPGVDPTLYLDAYLRDLETIDALIPLTQLYKNQRQMYCALDVNHNGFFTLNQWLALNRKKKITAISERSLVLLFLGVLNGGHSLIDYDPAEPGLGERRMSYMHYACMFEADELKAPDVRAELNEQAQARERSKHALLGKLNDTQWDVKDVKYDLNTLMGALVTYDIQGSGKISTDDFRTAFGPSHMDLGLDDVTIDLLIESGDKFGKGYVEYHRFIELLNSTHYHSDGTGPVGDVTSALTRLSSQLKGRGVTDNQTLDDNWTNSYNDGAGGFRPVPHALINKMAMEKRYQKSSLTTSDPSNEYDPIRFAQQKVMEQSVPYHGQPLEFTKSHRDFFPFAASDYNGHVSQPGATLPRHYQEQEQEDSLDTFSRPSSRTTYNGGEANHVFPLDRRPRDKVTPTNRFGIAPNTALTWSRTGQGDSGVLRNTSLYMKEQYRWKTHSQTQLRDPRRPRSRGDDPMLLPNGNYGMMQRPAKTIMPHDQELLMAEAQDATTQNARDVRHRSLQRQRMRYLNNVQQRRVMPECRKKGVSSPQALANWRGSENTQFQKVRPMRAAH